MLKLDRIGVNDNFFALGGDSIQSIQLVARANRVGLSLSARQVFEQQTIAGLAAVAGRATAVCAEQGLVQGEVPLTPIQRWLFEQELLAPHHFNQAVLLECDARLTPAALGDALRHLVRHHDALRLRFYRSEDGWHQAHAEDAEPAFEQIDLSALDAAAQSAALARHADRLQASLELATGPLVCAAWFDLGAQGRRLLLILHHLVVDGVSWRILLDDLDAVLAALQRDEPVQLAAKTTSFKRWAEQLTAYAGSAAAQRELAYWQQVPWSDAERLPVDHPGGINTAGAVRMVSMSLSEADTRALLQEVPNVYHTQINDALLTALAEAVAAWSGRRRLLVALEGHGREALFAAADVSRTVGWFTSLFPVRLDLGGASDPGAALKAVKEQLRAVPNRGIGYGILRYLGGAAAVEALPVPEPEISFNYLGQLDEGGGARPFRFAEQNTGALTHPGNARRHLIDVSAHVRDGRLQLQWFYNAGRHAPETMTALAERYVAALRDLIAHCKTSEGGFTRSDFPLAATRQIELDRLIAMLGGPRQIEDIYPLSATQQGLLFHSLYAPDSTVYVISLGCRLVGALDVDAFEQAWQRMVARHAVLRTAFVGQELEQPLQVVLRHAVLPFERHDWRTLDAAEQATRLLALQQAERARGFDFTRPPLLRLHLVRTAAAEYRLIWNSHHIVFDGWSMPILFNEVFAAYGALCRRETPQLKPPRPFRDYIGWLQRQDQGAAEAYWRRRLAGFATPTALGLGRPAAPTDPVDHYAEHEGTFPVALAEIEGFARRHRLTLNTLVQGAWALLLSRYGDSTEVVFGVTVSGRPAELPEVERTVGLFINTLPLRLAVPPRQKILDWLREVQARQSELTDYQYSALADVQRASEVPAGTPLFDSIVAFENYPAEMSALGELTRTVRITDVRPTERTNYPLTLQVTVGPTLSFRLISDAHRFEAVAVERLLGHFTHLFRQMIADPERPLSALALLSEAEHRQLVAGFNDTAAEYPRGLLHELFAAQAARTPDAVALSLDEATLSYGDLERRANQLAHHLRELGVGPDVVVGLCAERSFEMVIGLLGILKAGGAYLPLDPDYPADRLAFMLADAKVPVLLTQAAVADRLPASEATVVRLDADWPLIARCPETPPATDAGANNLAYVIYTSGSTGRPKGTLITHDCVTRLFAATDAWFDFGPHDVWTLFHSLAFDFSVWELWGALLNGGRLVVVPYWVSRSPDLFHELVAREGVTVLNQTPSAFAGLIQADSIMPRALSLRLVIFGGEALNFAGLKPWFERHGDARPQLINMYGITETTVHVTWRPVRRSDVDAAASAIGRPIPDLQAYVLDRHGDPVPLGVAGELYVGGAGLARGYLNRPGLTSERFVPSPFVAGERLYRTGDLARWRAEGRLDYLGRIDHQVKLRGFRIELGEIEAALLNHDAVERAAVVVNEDTDRRLIAYVVGRGDARPDAAGLRHHLQQALPDYMVPAGFVMLDQLPLTANGKLDRKALPAPDWQGSGETIAPRNPTEAALAAIWRDVLKLDRISVNDNFFALGGDSIQSIQLVARANRVGLSLSARQVFEQQTIAGLAAVAGRATAVCAEQGLVQGEVPLTPIQRWLFEQELLAPHHFNQAVLLECDAGLTPAALGDALRHLVRHHDALRLRFYRSEDGWHQAHAEDAEPAFEQIDLSALDAADQSAALARHADRLQASLELATGPLVCAAWFDLGAQGRRLLLILHHLVVDGVSWRILLDDLDAVLAALQRDKPVQLAAKTTSFKRWAEQLTAYAGSAAAQRELAYWQQMPFSDAGRLPVDHPGGINTAGAVRMVSMSLSEADTRALLQEVPNVYHTQINDALLTALAEAVAAWSGRRRLLVALEGHGREALFAEADVSRTVGWFTSLFPVRLDLGDASDPGAALKAVKEQLRAVPNRGIGYGILRYLGGAAAAEALPVPEPEISFNYLGQLDEADGARPFRFAEQNVGALTHPGNARRHLIDVSAHVHDGRLQLQWVYSTAIHQTSTIEAVAQTFVAQLQNLIEHCEASEGGFTPSDFPLLQANLSF
ncbi:amino acid adenylation domain-containing protein/non-ribosomal peptide synthase protein (TIGR01720 family) [Bradyrhizobium sp. AZCC 1719]|uniref:amino acid adenylation domain-containing protein n=1 Tax=Bradyrhizobium sp. AZCC 1719 TaxID=3117028 RepID=UPI002FF3F5E0